MTRGYLSRRRWPRLQDGIEALSLAGVLIAAVLSAACGRSPKSEGPQGAEGANTAPASSGSAGDFEGMIAMNIEGGSGGAAPAIGPANYIYYVKGDRARIEVSGNVGGKTVPMSAMILDQPSGKMFMLMLSRKQFMVIDYKKMAEDMAKNHTRSQSEELGHKITDTGKTDTIAGMPCTHYLIGDKQQIDACIAKGLGHFGFLKALGGGGPFGMLSYMNDSGEDAQLTELRNEGAFPLETTVLSNGKPTMTMRATAVERKSLPDSLFKVPADYQETKSPGLPMQP